MKGSREKEEGVTGVKRTGGGEQKDEVEEKRYRTSVHDADINAKSSFFHQ